MAEVTLVAVKRAPVKRLARLEIELPSRGGAVLSVVYETGGPGPTERDSEAFCDVSQALERAAQIVAPREAPAGPSEEEEEEEA